MRWCDAQKAYGPAKTLYNRWRRWSDNGVFARIMTGLAGEGTDPKTIMIDATYLKAHRMAFSLRAKKGARGRQIGRTEVAPELWTAGISGFSAHQQHDAASEEKTVARPPRRNHFPAFKAKVAVAATKGEKTLIELAQSFDVHPSTTLAGSC